jgi:hypothetical protein
VARPWLRFHTPLIEPDVRIARIPLSDKTSRDLWELRSARSNGSRRRLKISGSLNFTKGSAHCIILVAR